MNEQEELDDEIAVAIRAFAGQKSRDRTPHPLPEDLLAYQERQLSLKESEEIREHLALCDQCSDLVLDLAHFPEIEPAGSASKVSEDAGFARRWEAIRTRLKDEGALSAAPRGKRGKSLRRVFFPLPPVSGVLAAGLAAVSLGLAFWTFSLHQRLSELSRPAARVAVSSLVPRETAAVRDRERAERTAVPAWADRILLILNLFGPRAYSAYEVEIFDAVERGKKVWSSREVHRAPDGSFALEVPRGFLPAGAYRIELSGLEGSRRDPLAAYNLLLDFD